MASYPSSAPLSMGGHMPDMMKPITKVDEEATMLSVLTGMENLHFNPSANQPIVAETLAQASKNISEAVKKITYLVIESSTGWQFRLSPVRPMEMNQMVQYDSYPRKPLAMTPEDVPPEYWTHKTDSIKFTMDRYSGGFLMRGDFMAHGGEAALRIFGNNIKNLASGAIISLKLKITGTFLRAKQHWWLNNYNYGPPYSSIQEATILERATYGALSRWNKGLYSSISHANQISSRDGNKWDTLVLPFGTLDAIALNKFHTEEFRSGNALKFLTGGGKVMANLFDGLTIMEDPKWCLDGVPQDEIEAFLHRTRRGGWCYNNGNEQCMDDSDPNCLYGIAYVHIGKRNWEVKTLFELLKDSGRFDAQGALHPLHWDIVEPRNLQMYLNLANLKIYDGLLDPLMIQIGPGKYAVARTMGEVDIRYSPEAKLAQHARKVKRMLMSDKSKKLSNVDVDKIEELHRLQKELNDIDEIDENLEAYIVGIASSQENHPGNSGIPMLKASPTSGAPYPLFVENVTTDLGDYTRRGVTRVMYFLRDNEKYYIFMIRLDAQSTKEGSVQRGVEGDPFAYFAARLDRDVPPTGAVETASMTPDTAAAADGYKWRAGDQGGSPTSISVSTGIRYRDYNPDVAPERRNRVWSLWNTAYTQGQAGVRDNLASGQGFQAPELVPAPSKMFFYGGINGLRMMHDMHKNGQYRGWDQAMLKRAYDGVESLKSYMSTVEDIYTKNNLYFDVSFAPVFMQTGDRKVDGINTAVSALWGEFYRPIMVRYPTRLPDVANNMGVMVASMRDSDAIATYDINVSERSSFSRDKLSNIITEMSRTDTGPTVNPSQADVERLGSVLKLEDVGMEAKMALDRPDHGREIFEKYRKSTSGTSYGRLLYMQNQAAFPNVAQNSTMWAFYKQEVQPVFDQGTKEYSEARDDQGLKAGLTRQSSAAKLFGTVISLVIEGQPSQEIKRRWIEGVKQNVLAPKTSASVDSSSKRRRDRDSQVELEIGLRQRGKEASSGTGSQDDQAVRSTGNWVNTRLMVTSSYWNKMAKRLEQSGSREESMRILRSVIRPMNPKDAGSALAGEIFLDLAYDSRFRLVAGEEEANKEKRDVSNAAIDQYTRDVHRSVSYAQANNRTSDFFTAGEGVFEGFDVQSEKRRRTGEFDRPSSVYSKIPAGMRDYIDDISHGVYSDKPGGVPSEFSERVPSSSTAPSYMIRTQDTTVDPTTGTVRYVQSLLESPFLKLRIAAAERMSDWMERMHAKLYCFSPIHLDVYKSFLEHNITPFGVGFIMLRPFQTDLTGAVLFASAGKELSESGVNAPVAHLTLDGPHNVWNAYYSVWMGCIIYDPRLFMWLTSQVFRKNLSGMTGAMYSSEHDFDVKTANNPQKSGFVVFCGDNLPRREIPEPISITSHYAVDRYAKTITDKRVIENSEQHVPGLFYVICKHKLYSMNTGRWNVRASFWDEKFSTVVNTDCWSEDHCTWDPVTKKYSNYIQGQWHLSGLTPENMAFLEGTSIMEEIPLKNFTG